MKYERISQSESWQEQEVEGSRLASDDEHSNLFERNSDNKFPTSIFFIIGNEFCERFSYYGLRTVLALYFSSELLMSEDSATSTYHLWTFFCYSTTIIGAVMADSFTGRFRTILYLSVVYLIGNITLSLASIKIWIVSVHLRKIWSFVGLFLIAFGTGGIKPCVSAFGGDQFELPRQESLLTKFFAGFYFSINAGSLLSTILTPILREDVSCFGGDCFPLAFGVPAILMLVALVIFLIGTPRYKIVPAEGNIALDVVKCIGYAVRRKAATLRCRVSQPTEDSVENSNWIDLAGDKYSPSLIRDVKVLLRVLVLYLPLPLFWALFDQQGSRWTFQATRMSGEIGSWTIKPDQMQVLNPLLIMLLIPFFDAVVYPWFDRMRILTKPLHRMFVGGNLAALAFLCSGILQIQLENQMTTGKETLKLLVINAAPCKAQLNFEFLPPVGNISRDILPLSKEIMTIDSVLMNPYNRDALVSISADAGGCQKVFNNYRAHIDVRIKHQYTEIVVLSEYLGNMELINLPHELYNSLSRNATIRVVDSSGFLRHSNIQMKRGNESIDIENHFFSHGISASKTIEISPGKYEIYLPPSFTQENSPVASLNSEVFSTKLLLMHNIPMKDGETKKGIKIFDINTPSIHMLWILPQYIILSVGEIMFSVTGLEFSYKQAPQSMKSVVQSAWLMTTAIGNLIVVAIAQSNFIKKQSFEFFAFACLMLMDMVIFLCLANWFEKVNCHTPFLTHEDLLDSSESEEETSSSL